MRRTVTIAWSPSLTERLDGVTPMIPGPSVPRTMRARGLPTIVHHVPNPPSPHGGLGSEHLEYLFCSVFGVPLAYRADADAFSSPAIKPPTYLLVYGTAFGSR